MEISLPIIDWTTIGPMMIVGGTGLFVMILALYSRSIKLLSAITFAGLVASLVYTFTLWGTNKTGFGNMVILDNFSIVLFIVILTGSIITLLLSTDLLHAHRPIKGEYLALLMFCSFGMMVMASAGDLMMMFLGLETLSIGLYILAGFNRTDGLSLEASLKYFLLGAFASGFLLLGIAYVFGATGTTNLLQIITVLKASGDLGSFFMVGFALMLIGFGFKLALVPFHMWAPDVYEGSPTPVTAFMSTGVKAATFAVMLRIFVYSAGSVFDQWTSVISFLAIITMTVGNVIALSQTNIKRMLAYSSIAHAGYMMVAFAAGTNEAVSSIVYYLMTYSFMNIGAFGVVIYLESKEKNIHAIKDFAGLGFKRPILAAVMTIFVFSLAGIPPFAGFFAKFYAFRAAVNAGFTWLAVIGVINSVISVYYYLRIVLNMYMREPVVDFSIFRQKSTGTLALVISLAGVLILGLFPSLFLTIAGINFF